MKDYMLTYMRSDQFEITRYLDINFVNCLNSRKYNLGFIFMLAGGTISLKSIKQSLIISSTMKTELKTYFEVTNQVLWL